MIDPTHSPGIERSAETHMAVRDNLRHVTADPEVEDLAKVLVIPK